MAQKKKTVPDSKWYHNAIIYALDIGTFKDSDGDGIGDFKGATEKLDYLAHMGINCIWLLPFFASPERDNGYDIVQYEQVNPRFGTMDDFIEFQIECEKRSIRVILDLVMNHTSDQHPWFKAARFNRDSIYYDYYIWRKQPPAEREENVFKGAESSVWKYDEEAKAYYYHKYYHFEPSLNFSNKLVRKEMKDIMEFWMSFGISGFRVDAATNLFDTFKEGSKPSAGEVMEEFYNHVGGLMEDGVLLAEADVEAGEIKKYTGDGGRMNLLFNFLMNNSLFLAMSRKDAGPIIERLNELPEIPDTVQWVNFVRNSDELDLERLTEDERHEVFNEFAPNPKMKIFDRGIRRRTATMLQGNFDRIKMIYNLLFALPGTPMITYGDEIGMGDNLHYKGRTCVRTPMQWSSEANGGFSSADEDIMAIKPINYDVLSYAFVNVEDQQKDQQSLLHAIKKFITVRQDCEIIGLHRPDIVETKEPSVLGLRYHNANDDLYIFINLSPVAKILEMEIGHESGFKHLLEDNPYESQQTKDAFSIQGYGYRWLRKK